MERDFLYDEVEDSKTRFVSFFGEHGRFDLAIIATDRFYGKQIVLNTQSNLYSIIGHDDLDEPGYLEEAFKLSHEETAELREFLREVV